MFSASPAQAIGKCEHRARLATSLPRLNEVVREEDVCREKQFSVLAGQERSSLVTDGIGPLNSVPGVVLVSAASEPEFVQNRRCQCRNQRRRVEDRIALY